MAPETTRIRCLRLHDPAQRRESVAAALASADWVPTAPGETLMLRRVELRGALPRLAALAAERSRMLAEQALPGDDPGAEHADAVRFRSRAHLLACLIDDLLAERASQRWFWRGFADLLALPPVTAAMRALSREPVELPAVAQGRAWPLLWARLGDADTDELLRAIERDTGFPVWSATRPPTAGTAAPVAAPLQRALLSEPALAAAVQAVIAGQHAGAGRAASGSAPRRSPVPGAARLRLALTLALWQRTPAQLAGADAAARLVALEQQLLASARMPPRSGQLPAPIDRSQVPDAIDDGDAIAGANPWRTISAREDAAKLRTRPTIGPEQARAADPDRHRPRLHADADSARAIDGAASSPAADAAGPAHAVAPLSAEPSGERTAPSSPVEPLPAGPLTDSADAAAAIGDREPATADHGRVRRSEHRLITRCGGLFYLLNLMNLSAVRCDLALDSPPGEPGSGSSLGWIRLYQLGRALGCRIDAPLRRLLAEQGGLDAEADLDALPVPETLTQVLQLAARRCGPLWAPTLCALPAVVETTASHVDVHLRLDDVRLEVRRLGLDIDPGWLPWLGRVVAFHYGQPPELIGLDRDVDQDRELDRGAAP